MQYYFGRNFQPPRQSPAVQPFSSLKQWGNKTLLIRPENRYRIMISWIDFFLSFFFLWTWICFFLMGGPLSLLQPCPSNGISNATQECGKCLGILTQVDNYFKTLPRLLCVLLSPFKQNHGKYLRNLKNLRLVSCLAWIRGDVARLPLVSWKDRNAEFYYLALNLFVDSGNFVLEFNFFFLFWNQ